VIGLSWQEAIKLVLWTHRHALALIGMAIFAGLVGYIAGSQK
jgi:hypothetical protein